MRPARSSTFRCLEMAGWLISNGSASSVTVASPVASRARMARRVGSARAAKVRSRRSEACITVHFHNVLVIYKGKTGQSRLLGHYSRDAARRSLHLTRELRIAPRFARRSYFDSLPGELGR